MLKELSTIKIIGDYLRDKKVINNTIKSIDEVYNLFLYLETNKNKFFTLYVYNYLYSFISSNEVAKRKTSARVFEDFLAILLNGVVADTQTRKNLDFQVSDYFVNVKDRIAGNRREKADIIFDNNYCFSVKTLIAKNSEINMGSFEKKVLFDSLKVDNYLSERKSIDGAGVGSKPQFLKLLKLIETLSSYESFQNKFNQMVEFIYSDDLILAIKNDIRMELYFFSGSDIVAIFKEASIDKDSFLKLVNRYEGNSLRIDREILIQKCNKKIELDFKILQNTIISKINAFDYKLHNGYFDYFQDTSIKKEIFISLENIFDEFDKNFKELS